MQQKISFIFSVFFQHFLFIFINFFTKLNATEYILHIFAH